VSSSGGPPDSAVEPDPVAIAGLITRDRLSSYLTATSGDLVRALALYDWNTRASAAVLATSAMVEVIVRNALDVSLQRWADQRRDGRDWLDAAPLDAQGQSDVVKARDRATRHGRGPEVHGKVVAELSFGFWRYLVASRYLTALWIPGSHAAFPHGPADLRVRRQQVERRLHNLMIVRNRAAHHEPIHRRDLARDFRDAVTVAGWVHPQGAVWLRARSDLLQAAAERHTL
jgi:hypothetical protein